MKEDNANFGRIRTLKVLRTRTSINVSGSAFHIVTVEASQIPQLGLCSCNYYILESFPEVTLFFNHIFSYFRVFNIILIGRPLLHYNFTLVTHSLIFTYVILLEIFPTREAFTECPNLTWLRKSLFWNIPIWFINLFSVIWNISNCFQISNDLFF